MGISLEKKYISKFINKEEYDLISEYSNFALNNILQKDEMTGWVNLPFKNDLEQEIDDIIQTAKKIKQTSDFVVIVGIGGSYLGSKAIINALSRYHNDKSNIIFAGNNLSGEYINDLIKFLDDKDWSLCVISKSGTTLEAALTYKVLQEKLYEKYNDKYNERTIFITDKKKGLLKEISIKEKIKSFIIPSDIGGRYSVLSPVGLFPIAVSGFDINNLIKGAKDGKNKFLNENSSALDYAVLRNLLYNKGYIIEILGFYEPKLSFIGEWWKQLFGESEGKDKKGIFPTFAQFTTDLHSLGQYIQQGRRNIFETIIDVKENNNDFTIKKTNLEDNLDFLTNKTFNFVNKQAMLGTLKAHEDGGVPNIVISVDKIDEYNLGNLIYFFELSCAISSKLIGVNPFNQPGVEYYKKNMFDLLKK